MFSLLKLEYKMNKKGLSTVVTTLIIVLLSIIAITILWVVIKNSIKTGSETIGSSQQCFNLNLQIASAGYNASSSILLVSVKRDAGKANLEKLKFIVDGVNKVPVETLYPGELETRKYTINGINEKPGAIEIAGMLKGNAACSVSDTIEGSSISNLS